MSESESSIEQAVAKEARKLGLLVIKLWPFSNIGLPDRMLLAKGGKVLFLELKTPQNRLSPRQRYWRGLLIKYGFEYATTYGKHATLSRIRNYAARAKGGR